MRTEFATMEFGDYQTEIYMAGLRGVRPNMPVDFASLETRAAAALSPDILSYVQGGCGDEHTQRRNAEAFAEWGVVPRMLVDTRKRDLTIRVFGIDLPSPIFMSPIGVIGMCAQDGHGDLAAAHAARITGVPVIASTLSNDTLESVAQALGDGPGFFQLYTPKDKELAESLVARAEAAGFRAIVVTLDTWLTGWRPRDLNGANFPQLRGHVLENYFSDPRFRAMLPRPVEEDREAAVLAWAQVFGRTLTWDDLPWLRSITSLPLVLKGICHPDDARRALDAGSGRHLLLQPRRPPGERGDRRHRPATGHRRRRGGRAGAVRLGRPFGNRRRESAGAGATAVGIGRPYAYGLALGGVGGIVHVLRSILAETDLLMAVNGYLTLADLRRADVWRRGEPFVRPLAA